MYKSSYSGVFAVPVFAVALLALITLGGSGQAFAQHTHQMAAMSRPAPGRIVDIVRDPADVPPPVGHRPATTVAIELAAREVTGTLDPATGATYRYWTFNGKVPGPMIRVRQGDTVEVRLRNNPSSQMVHSIDFHAAIGPGGGAALSQVLPGQEKTFTFQATTPGLFVYHCGTPMIADHIANGMYGLILVEPPGGLPLVDREYYVMQGEIYTAAAKGKAGLQSFSEAKLMQEAPEYFVFNGAVDALTKQHPLQAKTGETVRLFFGDAGPNETSSLHVVGEIFTRDYQLGVLASPPLTGVQTASVPPGGAAILEIKAAMSGQFNFMDHAMARMAKGLMGTLQVKGRESAVLMHAGPAAQENLAETMSDPTLTPGGGEESPMNPGPATASGPAADVQAMTPQDKAEAISSDAEAAMQNTPQPARPPAPPSSLALRPPAKLTELDGCVTMAGLEVRLTTLGSGRTYRLKTMLPSADNLDRIVHVTGHPATAGAGSSVPTFAVDTVDVLAPNCHAKVSTERLRELRARNAVAPAGAIVVGMSDMTFTQPNITIHAGQTVLWKNTSGTVHNVVDDAAQAVSAADVQLPAGVKPFGSGYLQPGQTYSRTFTVPGVYRYVCTLHEAGGMKGVIVVKPSATTVASAGAQGK